MNSIIEVEKTLLEYNGLSVSEAIAGTILKVINTPSYWESIDGKDDYVIRTDREEEDQLIVSLRDGTVWGNDIEKCVFQEVSGSIKIDK